MSKLVTRGSKYTDEQRISAAVIYAAKGTYSAVIREKNIPKSTLSNWSKTDWWDEVIAEVRTEKSGEHRANYVEIIDKAQKQTLKALPTDEFRKLSQQWTEKQIDVVSVQEDSHE